MTIFKTQRMRNLNINLYCYNSCSYIIGWLNTRINRIVNESIIHVGKTKNRIEQEFYVLKTPSRYNLSLSLTVAVRKCNNFSFILKNKSFLIKQKKTLNVILFSKLPFSFFLHLGRKEFFTQRMIDKKVFDKEMFDKHLFDKQNFRP